MTALARLHSSSADSVSSTSFGSSSTIKIRPSLLLVSMFVLLVLELKNRKSPRHQPRLRPRLSRRADVLCVAPWPARYRYPQTHRHRAGAETRQTVYSHTSSQSQPHCP